MAIFALNSQMFSELRVFKCSSEYKSPSYFLSTAHTSSSVLAGLKKHFETKSWEYCGWSLKFVLQVRLHSLASHSSDLAERVPFEYSWTRFHKCLSRELWRRLLLWFCVGVTLTLLVALTWMVRCPRIFLQGGGGASGNIPSPNSSSRVSKGRFPFMQKKNEKREKQEKKCGQKSATKAWVDERNLCPSQWHHSISNILKKSAQHEI